MTANHYPRTFWLPSVWLFTTDEAFLRKIATRPIMFSSICCFVQETQETNDVLFTRWWWFYEHFWLLFWWEKNPLLGPLNELALLENYTPTPNRAARFFFSTKYYCCPEMGNISLDSNGSLVGWPEHTTLHFLGSNPDPWLKIPLLSPYATKLPIMLRCTIHLWYPRRSIPAGL